MKPRNDWWCWSVLITAFGAVLLLTMALSKADSSIALCGTGHPCGHMGWDMYERFYQYQSPEAFHVPAP